MKNVKQRVMKAMNEWDTDRLRSELRMFIDCTSDEELIDLYFDDIATEEEYDEQIIKTM